MGIFIDSEKKIFTIQTISSTYQMCVDVYGYLHHTYYGRRVQDADLSYINLLVDRSFSGMPYETDRFRDEQKGATLEINMDFDAFLNHQAISLDTIPREYSVYGDGDYRVHASSVVAENGSFGAMLKFKDARVLQGKYAITGMPAAYDNGGECETLEIELFDEQCGLAVTLLYGVFEQKDVITRAARITNRAAGALTLDKAASMCLDIPFGDWDLISFDGRHCMERRVQREPIISAIRTVSSTRGMTSHQHNPFVIVCGRGTTEEAGECYGSMLVYSGNHKTEVEVDQYGGTRIVAGINDAQFSFRLAPGEVFETPEVLLAFSADGLTSLSHKYHDLIKENIWRGRYKTERRPILLNNWEATYFNFTSDKIYEIAKEARSLGVEMMVLDDGWFGVRNGETSGLGDWFVNTEKLPGGLSPLIEKINGLGLKFGIWIEPEMVSEDSDLYRAHPDWALQVPGRKPTLGRHQLVLDMSRKEVVDYLYECLSKLLSENHIEYIKWDFNRCLNDVYSAVLPADRQGEVPHRYVLGLYDLHERLVKNFPDVLFEGCSGGGGRFDAGMLYYSPQIWCSDDTDAIERIVIQHGTSFGYPITSMGAHVSASPNHQTGRNTCLKTRGVVAMSGTFGYELDPSKLTDEEKDEIREQIKTFKELYWLIRDGRYYRLTDAQKRGTYDAWQYVSKDGSEALLNLVVSHARPNSPFMHVRLKGLKPDAMYEVKGEEGKLMSGNALMYAGYTFPLMFGDSPSAQVVFKEVK